MDLESVLGVLRAYDAHIDDRLLCLYPWGSRTYGCHSEHSDWDYVAVVTVTYPTLRQPAHPDPSKPQSALTAVECPNRANASWWYELIERDNVNVTFLTVERFRAAVWLCRLETLEQLWLPESSVLLQKWQPPPFHADSDQLRLATQWEVNRTIHKARRCLWKRNFYKGKKELTHAFRYASFAQQIAQHHRIVDYGVANDFLTDVRAAPDDPNLDAYKDPFLRRIYGAMSAMRAALGSHHHSYAKCDIFVRQTQHRWGKWVEKDKRKHVKGVHDGDDGRQGDVRGDETGDNVGGDADHVNDDHDADHVDDHHDDHHDDLVDETDDAGDVVEGLNTMPLKIMSWPPPWWSPQEGEEPAAATCTLDALLCDSVVETWANNTPWDPKHALTTMQQVHTARETWALEARVLQASVAEHKPLRDLARGHGYCAPYAWPQDDGHVCQGGTPIALSTHHCLVPRDDDNWTGCEGEEGHDEATGDGKETPAWAAPVGMRSLLGSHYVVSTCGTLLDDEPWCCPQDTSQASGAMAVKPLAWSGPSVPRLYVPWHSRAPFPPSVEHTLSSLTPPIRVTEMPSGISVCVFWAQGRWWLHEERMCEPSVCWKAARLRRSVPALAAHAWHHLGMQAPRWRHLAYTFCLSHAYHRLSAALCDARTGRARCRLVLTTVVHVPSARRLDAVAVAAAHRAWACPLELGRVVPVPGGQPQFQVYAESHPLANPPRRDACEAWPRALMAWLRGLNAKQVTGVTLHDSRGRRLAVPSPQWVIFDTIGAHYKVQGMPVGNPWACDVWAMVKLVLYGQDAAYVGAAPHWSAMRASVRASYHAFCADVVGAWKRVASHVEEHLAAPSTGAKDEADQRVALVVCAWNTVGRRQCKEGQGKDRKAMMRIRKQDDVVKRIILVHCRTIRRHHSLANAKYGATTAPVTERATKPTPFMQHFAASLHSFIRKKDMMVQLKPWLREFQ